jgi:hypothetical protein
MDTDLKKHLDRHNFDPDNACKKHLRNTNKSAMTVANRVLDCREEVLGFFKQQVLKEKRDERLAQEDRELKAEKNILQENSQGMTKFPESCYDCLTKVRKYCLMKSILSLLAFVTYIAMTEHVVDAFVKNHKIFPSTDKNASENTEGNEHGVGKPLTPKPPSKEAPSSALPASLLGANVSGGRGTVVGSTARQRKKEKERNSAISSVNIIDSIGEDLIRGCETEGNTSKLRALKQAMQHHILYQVSFILMLENELNDEQLVDDQVKRKGAVEEEEESVLLHSLASEEVALRKGPATDNKNPAAQFGQSLGKLCGLKSADIKNNEDYLASGSLYLDLVSAMTLIHATLCRVYTTYKKYPVHALHYLTTTGCLVA